jgi:phosphatidylglycerol:prolipoprotein diacylglycerol transferase
MLVHPQFDPIAFSLGPLAVRWYGLMYLLAFASFFLLGRWRLNRPAFSQASGLSARDLEDLLFWGGARRHPGWPAGLCVVLQAG